MFPDNTLSFNGGWASNNTQTITTTADSTNIIDLTGAGSGNAPAMIGGYPATNNAIGFDIGWGDGEAVPWVVVCVQTAPTSTVNTLTISLQSAPDNGSYSPGTYTVCGSTAAIAGSNLTKGTIIAFPVPPKAPGAALPRFYKLTYTASATLTPMVVQAGILLNPPASLLAGQYPSNFIAV